MVGALVSLVAFSGLAGSQVACGCTDQAESSIAIVVQDAKTGVPICDAEVLIREGEARWQWDGKTEARRFEGKCVYDGPNEREGVYEVTVARYGYIPQTLDKIEVEGDRCHVQGRTVEVRLEPDPNATPAPPAVDGG